MEENETNNNKKEDESFTKTSNNIEIQIENIKKEFDYQNERKNQELEALFEEINSENQDLKKELLQTKIELDEEKQKLKNIKNTFINIMPGNSNLILSQEDLTNSDIFNLDKNYLYLNDHIRTIKENKEKKISELTEKHDFKLKNFFDEKKNFEIGVVKILEIRQDAKKCTSDIFELSQKFFNDIEILLNENYNKDKYIITQEEKYEIMKEEINFLKERIIQEKINILSKINEINNSYKLNYCNLAQEIQNELAQNKKNFYNEQILMPFENINSMISNMKKNEQDVENNKYKLESENEILKNKINILEKEKNEILNKTSNFIFDKEAIISQNLLYKSENNKLKNEIKIINDENNTLLKNVKELNEELLSIKNKMNFDLKKIENNNKIILNQKENIINELTNKNCTSMKNEADLKNKLDDLNDQIYNLQQEIISYKEKEKNYETQIIQLSKKLNEEIISSNINEPKYPLTEAINKNISEKLDLMKSDQNKNINNNIQVDYDLFNKIQKAIKDIYQLHFNNNKNNHEDVLIMLNEINERLLNIDLNKTNQILINFNESFDNLEKNKNSQLYENILLYLINIKSQNKIEISKILAEKNSNIISKNNSGELSQFMTHNSSSFLFNKKYIDELKSLLEEKYKKLEERIRSSVTIGEVQELFYEFKNLYEAVIDSIIQSFYIYKTELSENNILTIQIPLDKYHQIINNTNGNLISIERSLNKKINEYKNQGDEIETALDILIKNVNMIY
jgi:hypothetical protein